MLWRYLVDLLHRANNDKALTTHERAIRKAVQGALLGLLADAAPQLYQVMLGHAHFDFSAAGLSALAGAIAAALLKLWLAQNSDPAIGAILDAYAAQKEKASLDALIQANAAAPSMQFVVPSQSAQATKLAASLPTVKAPVVQAGITMSQAQPGLTTIANALAGVPPTSKPDITQQATAAIPVVTPPQQP